MTTKQHESIRNILPQTNQDAPLIESPNLTVEAISEKEIIMHIVKMISQGKDNLRIDIRQKVKEMKDHFNKEI